MKRVETGDDIVGPCVMESRDLDGVIAIQNHCYPRELQETRDVFMAKLALSPEGCWVMRQGEEVVGYLFSHQWVLDHPPELNVHVKAFPEHCDCFYIHDIAIGPRYKGMGLGQRLFSKAEDLARSLGLQAITLVAVNQSETFWKRMGFSERADESPRAVAKMRSYGPNARYMVKVIA